MRQSERQTTADTNTLGERAPVPAVDYMFRSHNRSTPTDPEVDLWAFLFAKTKEAIPLRADLASFREKDFLSSALEQSADITARGSTPAERT